MREVPVPAGPASTVIEPPCTVTVCLAIERPRLMPVLLRSLRQGTEGWVFPSEGSSTAPAGAVLWSAWLLLGHVTAAGAVNLRR